MTEGISVLSALFFISLTLTVVMLVAWRTLGRERHAIVWASSFGVGALQWLVNIAYMVLWPGSRLLFGLVNLLGVLVVLLLLMGFRARARVPRNLVQAGAVLALAAIAITLAIAARHPGWAMAIPMGVRAALLAIAASVVVRGARAPSGAERGAAIALWVFAAFSLTVTILTVVRTEFGAPLPEIDRWSLLLGLPAAFTGVGLFAVLLLASDLADRMHRLASSDSLTGVLNRRGFREAAARQLANATRHGRPAAVVVADIDRFKSINDRFGHATGDAVLIQVSDLVSAAVRAGDLFGRIGGEEFAFFLEDADEAAACEVIERIRAAIERLEFESVESLTLTASFGVAGTQPDRASLDTMFDRADRALYAAKLAGRNRVIRASDMEEAAEPAPERRITA